MKTQKERVSSGMSIRCETENEAVLLFAWLESHGYKWKGGREVSNHPGSPDGPHFGVYGANGVYVIGDDNLVSLRAMPGITEFKDLDLSEPYPDAGKPRVSCPYFEEYGRRSMPPRKSPCRECRDMERCFHEDARFDWERAHDDAGLDYSRKEK